MKFLYTVLLILSFFCLQTAQAQEHSLAHEQVAYVELGGIADFLSLNYERVLKVDDGKELSAWTGRAGVGPNLGKLWLFATLNRVKETKPIFDKKNIFTEWGVGPILRRDFGIKDWHPYGAVYAGMRQHPTDASPWLLKVDLYILVARNPVEDAGFLGYVFPTLGFTIGRSF